MSFSCPQLKCHTVLFDPSLGPSQVLSLRSRVDLGAAAMKEYPGLPKAHVITGASPSDCLVSYPEQSLVWSYPSAETLSLCSIAPKCITVISYSYSIFIAYISIGKGVNFYGEMNNVMDCEIAVNEFKRQSHFYVTFRTNTLMKGMNFLIPHQWVKLVPLLFCEGW